MSAAHASSLSDGHYAAVLHRLDGLPCTSAVVAQLFTIAELRGIVHRTGMRHVMRGVETKTALVDAVVAALRTREHESAAANAATASSALRISRHQMQFMEPSIYDSNGGATSRAESAAISAAAAPWQRRRIGAAPALLSAHSSQTSSHAAYTQPCSDDELNECDDTALVASGSTGALLLGSSVSAVPGSTGGVAAASPDTPVDEDNDDDDDCHSVIIGAEDSMIERGSDADIYDGNDEDAELEAAEAIVEVTPSKPTATRSKAQSAVFRAPAVYGSLDSAQPLVGGVHLLRALPSTQPAKRAAGRKRRREVEDAEADGDDNGPHAVAVEVVADLDNEDYYCDSDAVSVTFSTSTSSRSGGLSRRRIPLLATEAAGAIVAASGTGNSAAAAAFFPAQNVPVSALADAPAAAVLQQHLNRVRGEVTQFAKQLRAQAIKTLQPAMPVPPASPPASRATVRRIAGHSAAPARGFTSDVATQTFPSLLRSLLRDADSDRDRGAGST